MSPWWILILLAVFLIGLTKSGFGSGVGLMIVPMAATGYAHLPNQHADAALALLLPLLVCGDFIAIYHWRTAPAWRIIRRLMPGTVVGIALGALLLKWFSEQKQLAEALINIEIGAESIFLVGLAWYREWRATHNPPAYQPSIYKSTAVGTFAGASSTLAHAAGPIIALHLLPQQLPRATFVGTGAVYFAIVNSAKLPFYYQAGLFEKVSPLFSLQFLPLVIVGAILGVNLNKRISDKLFTRIVYAATFALGWYLLFRGITGLRA